MLQKHETTIDGLNLTYYESGRGSPLLFLHGARVRAITFRRLLLYLSKRYTVIAPDMPGYGSSDTPQEAWSYANYAHFLESFLAELSLHDVTVVGYSMGGAMGFHLAASSTRVSKLILIDPAGVHGKDRISMKDFIHLQAYKRLKFYTTHPMYWRAAAILLRDGAQFAWKHRADRRQLARIRSACFSTPHEEALRHIKIPTTLIWGVNDWLIPVSRAEQIQRYVPQATLETVPGNHDWLVYDPLYIADIDSI